MLEVLKVPEVMRRVLLCMLEAVEGEICLLEVPKVMRCVLFRMLDDVEGVLCLLEVLEMIECRRRCAVHYSFAGGAGGVGGDTLRAALYAGGRGG